jgi:hypothetical protein
MGISRMTARGRLLPFAELPLSANSRHLRWTAIALLSRHSRAAIVRVGLQEQHAHDMNYNSHDHLALRANESRRKIDSGW